MGIKHRGHGDESPRIISGALMQIVPRDFVMFQNSKQQIACICCSKKLTNPMTLIAYSVLPESASSTSTKSQLQAENSTFLSGRARTKYTTQNLSKHVIFNDKLIFLGRGIVSSLYPLFGGEHSYPFLGGEGYPFSTRHP